MANPCVITFLGKELSPEEFMLELHDGALDQFIKSGIINDSKFISKPKADAVQKRETKAVPVVEAPRGRKEVGKEVRKPEKPADAGKQKEVAAKPAEAKKPAAPGKKPDTSALPKMQQRVVKNNEAGGWKVVSKKNMMSADGEHIMSIIEMSLGDKRVFINPKGDSFSTLMDAVDKTVKSIAPAKAEKPAAKKEPVKQEKKPEPKKPEPEKKQSFAWRRKFSQYKSSDLSDLLSYARTQKGAEELIGEIQEEMRLRSEAKSTRIIRAKKAARGEYSDAFVEEAADVWERTSMEALNTPGLTKEQKASIVAKAGHAGRKLKKMLGFDPGNLPALTDEQKAVRERILQKMLDRRRPAPAPVEPKPVEKKEEPAPIDKKNLTARQAFDLGVKNGWSGGNIKVFMPDGTLRVYQMLKGEKRGAPAPGGTIIFTNKSGNEVYKVYETDAEFHMAIAKIEKLRVATPVPKVKESDVEILANIGSNDPALVEKGKADFKRVTGIEWEDRERRTDLEKEYWSRVQEEKMNRAFAQAEKAPEKPAKKDLPLTGKNWWMMGFDLAFATPEQTKMVKNQLVRELKITGVKKGAGFPPIIEMRDGAGNLYYIASNGNMFLSEAEARAAVKKAEPAVELPAPSKGELVPVTDESMDVLDYLTTDVFPETVEDFVDALAELPDFAGPTGRAKAMARLIQMQNEGLVIIKGKKIAPSFKKQGNEYAPENIEEYAPESPEDIVSSNKRRSDPIGLVAPNKGVFDWLVELDITGILKKVQRDVEKYGVGGAIRKQFASSGLLTKEVFDKWNQSQADLRLYEARAIETVNRLKEQVKKDYGQRPTDAQIIELNLALEGKKTTPDGKPLIIPIGTLRIINDMRNQVDNLSRRFVRDGLVAGDMAAKFMQNLGVYLHRSYEKFDDPTWRDEVGTDTYNRAMDFLRNKYPGYSTAEIKGLIDYLLYSPKAPMAVMKGGSYGSMDLTVLKQRKGDDVLPPEIRALMGQYADPVVNFTRSIGKMSQLVAKNLFQQDVKKIGLATPKQIGEDFNDWFQKQKQDGRFLFTQPLPGFSTKIQATGVDSPLDGLYTSEDMAETLSRFNGIAAKDSWFMSGWVKATSAVNFGLTVLNPGTHVRNFLANPFFAVSNGHILNGRTPIDTKVDTEEEIASAEKARKELRALEARVADLRVQGMEDLAMEVKLQNKINDREKRLKVLNKKLKRAEDALSATSPKADKASVDIKKARVAIAKRNVLAEERAIKRDKDLLEGIFDVAELNEARQKVNDLLADKTSTPEAIKRAKDRVSRLVKRQADVDKFVQAKERKDEFIELAKEADELRETAHENDPLQSLLPQDSWENKIEKWKSYGLIDDGVSYGMMKEFVNDMKRDPLVMEGMFSEGVIGVVPKAAGKVKDLASKAYQMGDWVWKVRAFEMEVDTYRKAYPSLTLKEVEDMAAENVKSTYPTFSRIPQAIRSLKKVPIMGAFIPFPAEVVRTSVNRIQLAKKELSSGNPVLKRAGLKRVSGTAFALAFPTALSLLSRTLFGMNDDDEEALRQNLPDWSKNSTLFFLGKQEQTSPYMTSLIRYTDLGALDPYAVLKKPFVAALFQNKPIDEAMLDAMLQAVEPIANPQLLAKTVDDILNNQKPNGDPIVLEGVDDLGTRVAKRFTYLVDAVAPGKPIRRLYRASQGEVSESGKKYVTEDEIWAMLGFRVTTFDPTSAAERYATSEVNRKLRAVRKEAIAAISREGISDEERREISADYIKRNRRILELAMRKYNSLVRLGADPRIMSQIDWPKDMAGNWWEDLEEPKP